MRPLRNVEKALSFIRERLLCRLSYRGFKGTVERECNEIRFMLWAAAAAKKRDKWRQLLSLAQSSTWEQGTEIREVLDSVLYSEKSVVTFSMN